MVSRDFNEKNEFFDMLKDFHADQPFAEGEPKKSMMEKMSDWVEDNMESASDSINIDTFLELAKLAQEHAQAHNGEKKEGILAHMTEAAEEQAKEELKELTEGYDEEDAEYEAMMLGNYAEKMSHNGEKKEGILAHMTEAAEEQAKEELKELTEGYDEEGAEYEAMMLGNYGEKMSVLNR